MYRGDYFAGDTVHFKFTTQNGYGVPTALAGTPVVKIYKNGTDSTETTTGVTLTASFDSVTGLNHVAVDTSADGTFYAAGSDFQAVITTGTVDSQSVVGYVVAEFSIQNRTALRPTTKGRTLDVSAGGEAGVDWANVGSPTTSVGLTGTTLKLTSAGIDEILDEVIEGSYTMRQYLRLFAAALAGKISGAATTTFTIRDTGDSTDRVVATVDGDGNRTAVVIDVS